MGTLAVLGIVGLWQITDGESGVADSLPTSAPSTSIRSEAPSEPSFKDLRLLDGRSVTITADTDLTLESYSFFIEAPEIGERHVTVAAIEDPADVAAIETADEKVPLSETVTMWMANREGQPLFLSVDLGSWVVWLNVGNQENQPSPDLLLQLADRLTGSTDELGVVLDDFSLDYHELHLAAGQDRSVTLRVGACFNELIPGSETVEDPRHGTVIRASQDASQYASWCIANAAIEIVVDGRSSEFVDMMVTSLDVTIHNGPPVTLPPPTTELTTTTLPSADPATGPLFGDPSDVVLLFDDGIDGVLALDPDGRVGSRSVIKGQSAGDQPYRITRVGDKLIVGWGGIYASDIGTGKSTFLGGATIYVPAAESDRVWLIKWPGGRIGQGIAAAWQVDVAGEPLTEPTELDIDGYPAIGIPGGLALETDDGIRLWYPGTGSTDVGFGNASAVVADVNRDHLAYCPNSACTEMHVTNVSTQETVVVAHSEGFNTRLFGGRPARFSPDGTQLALTTERGIVLANTQTGAATTVSDDLTSDQPLYVAWSPDGTQLYAATYSYGYSETTLARYDIASGAFAIASVPFGGTLDFVVLEPNEAGAYLLDEEQPPNSCPPVGTQPSGRIGICGFRY